MANPTTNFNWQMPTNTDLVKDLPADFEVFGQAVDTSLMDLKGGTTGQILSKASNTDMDFTWIANDQGDITAVNVTSPITGGGTAGAVTVGIQDGTTAQKGAVQLEDSTSSTSTTKAATPNSVKSAYDLANGAIAKSTLNAKGDLISASADDTPSILAVGNNGETLVADSSATTGLRWQGNFAAAKNKFINGDFTINQRSFSSQVNGTGTFGFDRWKMNGIDGTTTFSAQVFTPGTAPVSGYEGINYLRIVTTGQTATNAESDFFQPIEDVRTFAGQTITLSFWAKANSGTPKVSAELRQNFGSGGSSVVSTPVGFKTISTSWQRYSLTIAVPSVSGKTIGTGSALNVVFFVSAGTDLNTRASSIGIQTNTFELWGVQAEAGSVATAFQTATGTLAGELAACQRYYVRFIGTSANDILSSLGWARTTTDAHILFTLPVEMRITPTAVETSTIELTDLVNEPAVGTVTLSGSSTSFSGQLNCATTGLTQFRPYVIRNDNNAAGYVAFTAEL